MIMKNNTARSRAALGEHWRKLRYGGLLAAGIAGLATSALGVNPEEEGGENGCQTCKDDTDSGGAASDPDLNSIDLRLNLGGVSTERPESFAAFFVGAGENANDTKLAQGLSGLQSYYELSPVKGLWAARLRLKSDDVDADAFKRSSLTSRFAVELTGDQTDSSVSQYKSDFYLVEIRDLDSGEEGYVAKWYELAAVESTGQQDTSTGLYDVSSLSGSVAFASG